MRKIREVLRLKYELGFTHRMIAKALRVAVGTVSEYLAKAKKGGLSWPLPEELSDGELEAGLFPPPGSSGARPGLDYAHIHEELRRHRELTLLQLWVEYAENKPGAYGYSRYCELYGQWKKKLNPTMRQRHRAGEKTFVDFSGKKPHIVDPKTGELVEMELFVGTLGASSYTYVEATLNQSLESWAKAHKGMSDYFGGSTEIWVPDNLKSGVDLVDRYEPGINRTYEELATHYGAVVVPARVFKPKDKAKVESAVQVAQRWILRELGFFIPKGAHFVVPALFELVEDADADLPDVLRSHLRDACSEIRELKDKCAGIEHELKALTKQLPEVQRLLAIPGIGLLTATAIVGFIGDLRRFPSGRRFSSYLGLVPKENSSGDIRRLGRITKRGDSYLRMLLTQGGRAVLRAANVSTSPPDKLRAWARKVHRSRGHNKAVIAVANKLARIVWAVSTREGEFQSVPVAA